MPLYEAKVRGRNNEVRTMMLQAKSEEEAMRQVAKVGRVVSFKKKVSFEVSRGLTHGERAIFFTRLSAMLKSRVGTSDALRLMRDTFSGKIQETAGRLLNHVENGANLAEAIEAIGEPDFPEAVVALIKAGSRSGDTWQAIMDANTFERELALVKKGASKGLAMGIFSFVSAGAMSLGSTFYVGPAIMESDLIQAANKDGAVNIDWINHIALGVGIFVGVVLIIGLFFWLLASVGRKIAPNQADALILKIPYYKDLVLARDNFIVLYGLALLIKSGVRIEEALRLAGEGAPRGALKTDLTMAMRAVKAGQPWPKAMSTLHPTDKAALLSAVDREQISDTLDTLAQQYRELYAQRLGSFVPFINLIAAIVMTITGGILFGQSILPMLMASEGMLG